MDPGHTDNPPETPNESQSHATSEQTDIIALQAERDALAQALQAELDAAMQTVPVHIRPLLAHLPPADALRYLRENSTQFAPRPAPSLDAGTAGERTPPLNLSAAQARLLEQARRNGYALDLQKMARRQS